MTGWSLGDEISGVMITKSRQTLDQRRFTQTDLFLVFPVVFQIPQYAGSYIEKKRVSAML